MTTSFSHSTSIAAPLLPTDAPRYGPATRARLRRTLLTYGAIWIVGMLPSVLDAGAGWQAIGLGLVVPGGGFLAAGHLAAGVATLLGFVVALLVWWAMGPTVLPPLVWMVTALLAGSVVSEPPSHLPALAVAASVWAIFALGWAMHAVRHRGHLRASAHLNERLREVRFEIGARPDPVLGPPVVEHSEQDLRRLRAALDLALQPVDAFEGFTHLDQFREGALRYQLNALSYGLSMSQYTRTPAFGGYLAEAQRNTIEKMMHRKAGGYWAIENLWGNLSTDRDPVANNENVMLTGFLGLQVGMYTALNDQRYLEPGSLAFRWDDDTVYPSSLPELAGSIHRNVQASEFSLFPCEPNWIYTVCNTFGLNTTLVHEQFGPGLAEPTRAALAAAYQREFMRPDGRLVGVRSRHLGLSWNFWASPSVQLATTYWMHPGLPELAERSWWLVREGWLQMIDGQVRTPRSLVSRLDPGNYRIGSDTFTLAVTAMAAREMGDEAWAVAAERTVAEHSPLEVRAGAERVADASGLANSYLNLARFGRRDGLRDLVCSPTPIAWREGPRLAQTAYPDVLVARAVTDGHALDLVLRPGNGPVRTAILIDRLIPAAAYEIRGGVQTHILADQTGQAVVEVDLGGRIEVQVRPIA